MRLMAIKKAIEDADAMMGAGKPDQAVRLLLPVVREHPENRDARWKLAFAQFNCSRFAEAEDLLRALVEDEPGSARNLNGLGNVLTQVGKIDEAIAVYRQAIDLNPADADLWFNLGNVLRRSDRVDDAAQAYSRASALAPSDSQMRQAYSQTMQEIGIRRQALRELPRAIEALEASAAIDPLNAVAHNNLGTALLDQALTDAAIRQFRRAIALRPDYALAHSNLIYSAWYSPNWTAEQVVTASREWGARHADPLAPASMRTSSLRTRDKRLRIGYVSPNFRQHPLGNLLLPILKHHDHDAFEIICYSDAWQDDEVTEQFKIRSDEWRQTRELNDRDLSELIRTDEIDVLVDLTLHMAQNRMLVFARRPAPVQMTYLAYPATSGITMMDLAVSDVYLDPPAASESHYVERIARLPRSYWCYPTDEPECPEVQDKPAIKQDFVFGALNATKKLNPLCAKIWASILEQVPASRLAILVNGGRPSAAAVLQMLQGTGISPEQVIVYDRAPRPQYLRQFRDIDLSLDPFPYNGHTTSLDSLWMGVPVIALAGQWAVARGGVSILSNLGQSHLIAKTHDEYIAKAVKLALDDELLEVERDGLRERMRASALTDAAGTAAALETIYRNAWQSLSGS